MRAERAIKTLLESASGVTAIVGSRIWGGVAEQDALPPMIIYRKLSATRDEGLDPADTLVNADTCIVRAQIEILCVTKTYEQLKALGEAVRFSLAYKSGTIAGTEVLGIFVESEGADEYLPGTDDFVQSWTFRVEHNE